MFGDAIFGGQYFGQGPLLVVPALGPVDLPFEGSGEQIVEFSGSGAQAVALSGSADNAVMSGGVAVTTVPSEGSRR